MKKVEYILDNESSYKKRMKTIQKFIGKKDLEKLKKEFNNMKQNEIIDEMIENIEIAKEFCASNNEERKLFLQKYSRNLHKYIIFNSWLYMKYFELLSFEINRQDFYSEEYRYEFQKRNNQSLFFHATAIEVLNKLKNANFNDFFEIDAT